MFLQAIPLGGGGFVGSNLAYHLSDTGDYSVRVVDVHDDKLRLKMANNPIDFVDLDIRSDRDALDDLVRQADVVVNLAAHVHPSAFLIRPLEVVETNLFASLETVASCIRNRKFLLHFSTSEVYGKTGGSEEPFREDETDCILGPIGNHRWIYSCAKQMLDRIIHAHGLAGELDYAIVRPFNFVGPLMDGLVPRWTREDNPRVLANFMSALIYDRPLELVNGGRSRRCFTFIDDGVDALELIIRNRDRVNRQIFNIGNPGNETTIADLARLMVRLYRAHCDPKASGEIRTVSGDSFYGPGYEDCDRRLPDISKIQGLGWAPRHDLEETFRRCVIYFHRNRAHLESMLKDATSPSRALPPSGDSDERTMRPTAASGRHGSPNS